MAFTRLVGFSYTVTFLTTSKTKALKLKYFLMYYRLDTVEQFLCYELKLVWLLAKLVPSLKQLKSHIRNGYLT